MSEYGQTESFLVAAYSGLGTSSDEVRYRREAAVESLRIIKAKVWDVAYQQGRWDERTAQHIEKHPQDENRLRGPRDNPYREETK